MSTRTAKPVQKAPAKAAASKKAAAAKAPAPKKEKVLNTCGCLSTVTKRGNEEVHSSCGAKVARRFAPGHDAKLKSLLIRKAVEGGTIVVVEGGMRTELDPTDTAKSLGWGGFITAAKDKASKRAAIVAGRAAAKASDKRATKANKTSATKTTKKATKPAAKAEPKPTPGAHPVRIDFGGFVVDANIDAEDGDELIVSYTFEGVRKTDVRVDRSKAVN